MLGTRAIYHDGWKAASVTPAAPNAWGDFADPALGAVQRDADPSECHDLAEENPEKLQELVALWWAEAGKYGALPLESRDALGILLAPRPQLSKPRDRYIYYPDCAEVPESVTAEHPQPLVRDRGRAEHRHSRGERRPLRAGLALRRARALRQGRQAQVRLQLGRRVRADHRVDEADPDRRVRALGRLREGGRRDAGRGDAQPLHRRREGRRGEDQDPARASSRSPARGSTSARKAAEPVTDDYPGNLPVGVRRRDDPPGHRRRRRRAVGRSREGSRRRVRTRLTDVRGRGGSHPGPCLDARRHEARDEAMTSNGSAY